MEKQTSRAFGKEIYLLGADKDGIKYWLETPKWNCGWYWGFGYVECYTNNNEPSIAKDITTHQHFDGLILNGKSNCYDNWKSFFAESVLIDKEIWQLLELMKSCYTLKKVAELYHTGGSHITNNPCKDLLQNTEKEKEINEVILPALFKEIKILLS